MMLICGKKLTAFGQTNQWIDDRLHSLVLRDIKDNDKKALTILREH